MAFPALGRGIVVVIAIGVYGSGIVLGPRRKTIIIVIADRGQERQTLEEVCFKGINSAFVEGSRGCGRGRIDVVG